MYIWPDQNLPEPSPDPLLQDNTMIKVGDKFKNINSGFIVDVIESSIDGEYITVRDEIGSELELTDEEFDYMFDRYIE